MAVISISNLAGEDLILVSSGPRKLPSLEMSINSTELNPREMLVKVKKNDQWIDIFDLKSGDLIGSRSISSNNNFLFEALIGKLTGNYKKLMNLRY